jgi:hypothetical protein
MARDSRRRSRPSRASARSCARTSMEKTLVVAERDDDRTYLSPRARDPPRSIIIACDCSARIRTGEPAMRPARLIWIVVTLAMSGTAFAQVVTGGQGTPGGQVTPGPVTIPGASAVQPSKPPRPVIDRPSAPTRLSGCTLAQGPACGGNGSCNATGAEQSSTPSRDCATHNCSC